MSEEELAPAEQRESQRFAFVDLWRGFIIIYMLFSIFVPESWMTNAAYQGPVTPILEFLLVHPPREAFIMHLIDIGAVSFVFVLGLMFSVTFQQRQKKSGTAAALKHIMLRYGVILVLGFSILFVSYPDLIYTKIDNLAGIASPTYTSGVPAGVEITVLAWDVIPSLGLVGFVGIPFLFLRKKLRMIVAYAWLGFYGIMLMLNQYTRWASNAASAVFGGIYFCIFGFGSAQIMASAIGEYLVEGWNNDRSRFLQQLAVFGGLNLLVGVVLLQSPYTFVPGYILVAMGTTILGWFLFIYLDMVKKWPMRFLKAYGNSPFFVYLITVIPMVLVGVIFTGSQYDLFSWDLFITLVVIAGVNITIIWLVYVKGKRVRTDIVAIIGIAVVLGLGLPLRLLGII
jgi:hypothetical protein